MTSETTKRVQLSRALILETALRLATDEPKRKLTTTRLGKELGADPTAVYRHFRNRDELVMAVADQVVKEVLDSYEPAGAWRESLTQFLLTVRSAFLRRPALAIETISRFLGGENERRLFVLNAGWLAELGLSAEDSFWQLRALGDSMYGAIWVHASDLLLSDTEADRERRVETALFREVAGGADVPFMLPEPGRTSDDFVFLTLLNTHLDGLEVRAKTKKRTRR